MHEYIIPLNVSFNSKRNQGHFKVLRMWAGTRSRFECPLVQEVCLYQETQEHKKVKPFVEETIMTKKDKTLHEARENYLFIQPFKDNPDIS